LRSDLTRSGIRPGPTVTVPTGIELEAFYDVFPDDEPWDSPTVFYMGRSADLDLLLKAAPMVTKKVDSVQFRLAGMESDDLKGPVPDSVEVLGFIPEDELYRELAKAHVCVSPYMNPESAGRPVKLLEYMAAEKCIVATDREFNTQMLTDDVNAIITPPEPEAFSDGICRVLADKELRTRLGQRARDDIKQYSLETTRERLTEALKLAVK
jgi:glycosyltransferase involved in cell wall biosynthesis